MKPTLPEDREIDEEAADISRRYRDAASEQPSPRIDAAILEAARREAARPAIVRNWQVPAAVAAVLVIGVSLSLLTREGVETLPPPDQSRKQAEVGKPAAPSPAMRSEPAPKAKLDLQSRPSRDRSERGDREAQVRHGEEASIGQSAAPPAPVPEPTSVQQFDAPAAKELAENAVTENTTSDKTRAPQSATAGALKGSAPTQRLEQEQPEAEKKALADDAAEKRAKSLRKQESPAAPASAAVRRAPEQWLRNIEEMIRNGKQADARLQLAEFRKRHPDYRLPDALQSFEREAQPGPK